MGIIDRIKGNPFERMKRDDLTAERIKLERDEKLKIAEAEKFSARKKELFNKGFKASEAEKRSLARDLQVLDQKITHSNILLKKASAGVGKIPSSVASMPETRSPETTALLWISRLTLVSVAIQTFECGASVVPIA